MPVSHTDKNSSEAVPGNESSTTTASCGKSKHARSLETVKDCSATVSNNRAHGSVTVDTLVLPGTDRRTFVMIVGSLITIGVVPGYK